MRSSTCVSMSPAQSPKYAGTRPFTCVQYTRCRFQSTSSTSQHAPAMAMRSPGGGGFTMVPSSALAPYGELFVLLEHRVELERVGDALTRESHDEAARLGLLDLLRLEEVAQEHAEVVGGDAVEVGEREHAGGELRRRELPARGERGHGLVVEQAVG